MREFFKAITEIGIFVLVFALIYYVTSGFGNFKPLSLGERASEVTESVKSLFERK